LFGQLSDDLVRRNRHMHHPVIFLSDGERALWEKQREYFPWAIGVLDIFHVLERLWLAAHCLHPEGSAAAADSVSERFRSLLEGKVKNVIAILRTQARHQAGAKRRTLRQVANYFANNQEHMKYDEYLAQGYPIGSGVAEGPADMSSKTAWNKAACAGSSPALRPCSTLGPSISTVIGRISTTTASSKNRTSYTQKRLSGRRVAPKSLPFQDFPRAGGGLHSYELQF
jgi:hypothetical protein